MRLLKYLFLFVVALCLITVALANRSEVGIQLLPDELAGYVGQPLTYSLPLFVVIFASIVVGLLIGFVWEWFREHQFRADAAAQRRKAEALSRDLADLKAPANANGKPEDDILALVDGHR